MNEDDDVNNANEKDNENVAGGYAVDSDDDEQDEDENDSDK